jgi:hypothetical protein
MTPFTDRDGQRADDVSLITPLFAGLAFLFPLTLYLLFLAYLNARRHATLISGPWDFVGVLVGVGGFIVAGGWFILQGLSHQWQATMLLEGRARNVQNVAHNPVALLLWFLCISYFVLVVGGAAWLLWRRQKVTVIYHCETNQFIDTLLESIQRLGLEATYRANQFVIRDLAGKRPGPAVDGLVLEVDPFPAMRHITLCWDPADNPGRRAIEAELARRLQEVESRPSPVAVWLLTVAGCLVALMLFSLGLVLLLPEEMR